MRSTGARRHHRFEQLAALAQSSRRADRSHPGRAGRRRNRPPAWSAPGAPRRWDRRWRCAAGSGETARRPFRRAPRFRHRAPPARRPRGAGSRPVRDTAARSAAPLRDCRRTSSFSMKAMARTPSHLTSNSQSSPRGGWSASVAVMGSMAAGISAWRAPPGSLSPDRRWLASWRGAGCAAAAALRTGLAPDGCSSTRGPPRPRSCAWLLRAGRLLRDLLLRAPGEHAGGVRLHVPARAWRTRRAS